MGLTFSGDSQGTLPNVSMATNASNPLPTNELPTVINPTTAAPADNYNQTGAISNSIDLSRQPQASTSPSVDNAGFLSNVTTSGEIDDFKLNLFGSDVYPFRWMTLTTLYSWLGPLSSLAMIIGCVMPYVPQYITIHKNRSAGGFSTYVCLTLLLANILRIAFWYGKPFELPLLIQSILMILAQILLLELCVRVENSNVEKKFLSLKVKHFWRWTDLASYLEFLIVLSLLLGTAVYFLKECTPFIEALGYCALVTESMLGLPQVIKNYRNRSVQGMSLIMVLLWLLGDIFKTGYFIQNAVPYQFWLCGLLQITIDLLILFQVCLFRQNAPMKNVLALKIRLRK